ncbi:MAG: hypothetical protein US61_C0033G0007 [Parcubacteria group bacterium GW2011_GWE2_37_8]|nr:MAG: hypothetical protein US61_C0033G0007 [Parcubacteria group bacterium GW2011_GWE2_37_8]
MITATIQKITRHFKILRHIKIWMMFMAFTFLPMFASAEPTTEALKVGIIDFYISPLDSILKLLVYGVYVIITFILGKLVNLSASFMEWSLKLTMTSPKEIVGVGWEVSLGLANNLFILILLAIAIGTILGLPQINKKLLPTFLIIALLINFSMVIGNIVIDASNVLALSFLNSIQKNGGDIGERLMTSMRSEQVNLQLDAIVIGDKKISELAKQEYNKKTERTSAEIQKQAMEKGGGVTGAIAFGLGEGQTGQSATSEYGGAFSDLFGSAGTMLLKAIYIIFIQLVIIITFLFGGIYLLSRTFWLWLLLMLAPLAWIAKLIPKAEHYWDDWWKQFFEKAFFAPVYLFMVSLAVNIAEASGAALAGTLSSDGVSASAVIQMLIVAFLMMAGIHYGQKAGGGFANGVINYGKGLGSRYGKALKSLRNKGFIEKQLERLKPESLAKGTAALLATRGGKITGFDEKKIKSRMAKEKYAKIREQYEGMSAKELWKEIQEAQQKNKTSPELSAAVREFLAIPSDERVAGGMPGSKDPFIGALRAASSAGLQGQTSHTWGTWSPPPPSTAPSPKTSPHEYSEEQKAMGLSR